MKILQTSKIVNNSFNSTSMGSLSR